MVPHKSETGDTSPMQRYAAAGYLPFLIPIIPPNANLTRNSQGLADKRGKVPGKQLPSGDWVGFGEWPKHITTPSDIAEWSGWQGASIGIRCGSIVAVDVDVTDERLALLCRDVVRQALGTTPIRVGNRPKHLHVYRLKTGETLKKLRFTFVDATGVQHAVEVLADGQQFVAEGVHPKSGRPYVWGEAGQPLAAGLAARALNALPEVSTADVRRMIQEIQRQMLAAGCTGAASAISPPTAIALPTEHPSTPGRLSICRDALAAIPNDGGAGTPDYDEWTRITAAFKAACGAEQAAYEIWEAWSLKYGTNTPDNCRQKWISFRPPYRLGEGYLIDKAREHGFKTAAFDFERVANNTAVLAVGETPEISAAVNEINRDHIFVWTGTEGVVRQRIAEPGQQPRVTITTIMELRTLFASRTVQVPNHQGTVRSKKIADVWRDSPNRREVRRGFTFHPGGAEVEDGKANLWAGYAVEPSSVTSCELFIRHVYEVLCGSNPVLFAWVADWLANLIQGCPKPGTAIAIRGRQGAGKSIVGDYLGVILGEYRVTANSDTAVTGNFNAQLGRCQLLQADEAFLGGDKKAAAKLKDIITSATLRLEQKGRDAVSIENHIRILVTSNDSWCVPADIDDRRWLVLDADPKYCGNAGYFDALGHEMSQGGPAALLHSLLRRRVDVATLRKPPVTEGLAEQKRMGLGGPAGWLFDAAIRGGFLSVGDEWPEAVSVEALYDDYRRATSSGRGDQPVPANKLAPELSRAFPGFRLAITKRTVSVGDLSGTNRQARKRCYVLPPLPELRGLIDRALGVPQVWE